MFLPGKNRDIPLVFEVGTFTTRAGFAGEDLPRSITPTVF